MKSSVVIESFVADVMRQVPRKDRNEIGLELRDLLTEMLAERTPRDGGADDDATVLAMLREFGTPAEIAARYRSPGPVIIPAEQTRSFALLSIGGVGLQWALTLPSVFAGQPLVGWWLGWGLGALWWPGFLAMAALAAAGIRQIGLARPAWRPRVVDPDRVNRGTMGLGLAAFLAAAVMMICLPWVVRAMAQPLPRVFAFDPDFLGVRALPVVFLWFGAFALRVAVLAKGRWTPLTRRLDIACSLAFIALLGWWLAAGSIFLAKATDDGAAAGISLVILLIVVDVACKLYRRRPRIRTPKIAG